MTDRDSAGSTRPVEEGSHARDLRFAGAVSAGLISAILVAGALLAPVSDFGGGKASIGEGSVQTVRLPAAPRPTEPRGGGGEESGPPVLAPGPVGPATSVLAPTLGGGSTPALGGSVPALPDGSAEPGLTFPSGGGRSDTGAASGSARELANPATNELGRDTDTDGIKDQSWLDRKSVV